MAHHDRFSLECPYRFDHVHLVPGNKSAGFTAQLRVPVLQRLNVTVSDEQRDRLMDDIMARLRNGGLLPNDAERYVQILWHEATAVPKAFIVEPMFGGSIGADPDHLKRTLNRPQEADAWPLIDYTPHNVDLPQHALALMVMVCAWSEWALRLPCAEGADA